MLNHRGAITQDAMHARRTHERSLDTTDAEQSFFERADHVRTRATRHWGGLEGRIYLDVGRCGLETSYSLALTLSIAVATLDFSADSSADPQTMVPPLAR